MPLYAFKDEKGREREEYFPMAEAPSLGETITRANGERWTRIPACGSILGRRLVAFTSNQIPRRVAKYVGWKNVDEEGRPRFDSRAQIREFCAKSNAANYPLEYDAL